MLVIELQRQPPTNVSAVSDWWVR